MNKKIYITRENRYLSNTKDKSLWFEQVSDNLYTIYSDESVILDYCGIGFDDLPDDAEEFDQEYTDQNGVNHKSKIYSFDPSGGPFISINNYKIEGKEVKRIFYKDNVIYFEV